MSARSNEVYFGYMSKRYPKSMWPDFPHEPDLHFTETAPGNFHEYVSLTMSDGEFGVFKEEDGILSISFSISTNGYAIDYVRHFILGIKGFKLVEEVCFGPYSDDDSSAASARAAVYKMKKEML